MILRGISYNPYQAVVENPTSPEPTSWRLLDTYGREYGRVTVVRVAGEPAYRVEFRGEHIGYEGTLRVAVERVHSIFIRAHTPGGAAAAAYTIRTPSAPR